MTTRLTPSTFWLCLLAALLGLLWLAEPAFAGFGQYFSGFANRTRVIQICVVAMCLGLFILLKKFVEEPENSL